MNIDDTNKVDKKGTIHSMIHKRKRGRPRKNDIVDVVDKSGRVKKKDDENDEILLNLPISFKDIKKMSSIMNDVENINSETEKSCLLDKDNIFTITDITDSPPKDDLYTTTKLKEKDEIIKNLKKQLENCRNADTDQFNGTNSVTKMNLNLINTDTGKGVPVNCTDIVCWWCTCSFDTVPCFIPDKIVDNEWYVFGCFCSYNCAVSYNINMNDYNMWNRHSLIKKMCSLVCGVDEKIEMAPPKEVLKKYGGTMTVEEYRNSSQLCKKECKMILPPMVGIVPLVESRVTKYVKKFDPSSTNSLVLKRSKPLPNSKSTLMDTLGVRNR